MLINKINEKYLNEYCIFMVIFIFHLPFIFQGLDVTDTGFHLMNQVSAFSFPVEFNSISPMIFLTDFVGGMWLSLIGKPSLIWARLGGVLVIALNAPIIFSILSAHFERRRVFFVVLVSTLFITMRNLYIIDYFTFPAFLISIEFWILNKTLIERGENNFYNFMLGFMVIPIILCRIPLILITLIPILIFVYGLFNRTNLLAYRTAAITSSLGFCCAAILFGVIYLITGVLHYYFNYIYLTIAASASGNTEYIDQSHSMHFLIRRYLLDCEAVAKGTIILCILFYVFFLIKRRLGSMCTWIASLSLTFVIILFMINGIIDIDDLAYDLLEVAVGLIILVSLTYVVARKDNERNRILDALLFSGIMVMIINPVGSNTGILKSVYGMWLILPLAILCGFQIGASPKNRIKSSIFSLMNCILVSLLILILFFHSTNIYRDDMNRFHLDTTFSSSSLQGIYSTPDRAKAVDELIIKIRGFSNEGDKLLMFNSIPLFLYLTETRSALGNPWLDLLTLEQIKSSIEKFEKEGKYPKLFIYSKVNTRDRHWPNDHEPIAEKDEEKFNYLKYKIIDTLGYYLVWENEVFAIYQRPN